MADGGRSIGSMSDNLDRSVLDPSQLAARSFGTGFRGYDQDEVRAFLRRVATGIEHMLEEQSALRPQVEELERRLAEPPQLSDDEIAAALGDETAQVIASAQAGLHRDPLEGRRGRGPAAGGGGAGGRGRPGPTPTTTPPGPARRSTRPATAAPRSRRRCGPRPTSTPPGCGPRPTRRCPRCAPTPRAMRPAGWRRPTRRPPRRSSEAENDAARIRDGRQQPAVGPVGRGRRGGGPHPRHRRGGGRPHPGRGRGDPHAGRPGRRGRAGGRPGSRAARWWPRRSGCASGS